MDRTWENSVHFFDVLTALDVCSALPLIARERRCALSHICPPYKTILDGIP